MGKQADITAPLLVPDVFRGDSLLIYESDGDLIIDSVCCGNSGNIITKEMVLFMAKKMGIVK